MKWETERKKNTHQNWVHLLRHWQSGGGGVRPSISKNRKRSSWWLSLRNNSWGSSQLHFVIRDYSVFIPWCGELWTENTSYVDCEKKEKQKKSVVETNYDYDVITVTHHVIMTSPQVNTAMTDLEDWELIVPQGCTVCGALSRPTSLPRHTCVTQLFPFPARVVVNFSFIVLKAKQQPRC